MRQLTIPAVLSILVLTGCASGQLSRDQPVSTSSSSGVIVLGMDVQSEFRAPRFTFMRYDPRTGQADPDSTKSVTPGTDDLSSQQKFAAAMTGQSSRPRGRQYFVVELPPGEWFLYYISGFYSDGLANSYSATSFLSKGTIAFPSSAGVARYLGEYRVTGRFGEALRLEVLADDPAAAQAALEKYPHIELALQPEKPALTAFSCVMKTLFMSKDQVCDHKTVKLAVFDPLTDRM